MAKENVSEDKGKHNVSLKFSNGNNKKTWVFFVENKSEYFCEPALEKLPKNSEDGQFKYLKHTLNSIYEFFLLLVMSFVESRFKILTMYW